MSTSQVSTAISDALLALSAFNACYNLGTSSLTAVTGFLLVGSAACCGVHRFGSSDPSAKTIWLHQTLSWTASVLGMACIAAAYHRHYFHTKVANMHIAAAVSLVLLQGQLPEHNLSKATEMLSSAAILSTLLLSALVFNPYGIIGSVLYVVAGILVGTKGRLYGVLCVDIFHYILAIANIALMMGLSRPQTLVYYRPAYSS